MLDYLRGWVAVMWPHRCRYEWESVTVPSVISSYPVIVKKIGRCGCGSEVSVITEAGFQQMDVRALLASHGEIHVAEGRIVTHGQIMEMDARYGDPRWPPDGVHVAVAMLPQPTKTEL